MKLGKRLRDRLKDDSWDGCGISWLWGWPKEHPFHECCVAHDEEYNKEHHVVSRKTTDDLFLICCLGKAGECKKLRRTAGIWYRIVRAFGWMWW